MNTQYDTWEQLTSGTTQAVNNTIEKVIGTYGEFKTNVEEAMKAAGTSTDGFKDKVESAATEIPKDTEEIAKEVKEDSEAMTEAIGKATSALTTLQQTLESSWASVANNTTLAGHIGTVIGWYNDLTAAANNAGKAVTNNNTLIGNNNWQIPGNYFGGNGNGSNLTTTTQTYTLNGEAYTKLSDNQVYKNTDFTVDKDGKVTLNQGATASSYYFTSDKIEESIGEGDATKLKDEGGWVSTQVGDNKIYKSEEDYKRNQPFSTLWSQGSKVADQQTGTYEATARDGINPYVYAEEVWNAPYYNMEKYRMSVNWDNNSFASREDYGITIESNAIRLFPDTEPLIKVKRQGKSYFMPPRFLNYWDDIWNPINNTKFVYGDSFDTGGYTGAWGPEGRLAMLHQKEIVLNAHDTENFLSAIELVRSLSERVDLTAAAHAQRLAEWRLESARAAIDTSGIEQNITIHAEFPAAQDRFEIEEAFNSLALRASQYVNRK